MPVDWSLESLVDSPPTARGESVSSTEESWKRAVWKIQWVWLRVLRRNVEWYTSDAKANSATGFSPSVSPGKHSSTYPSTITEDSLKSGGWVLNLELSFGSPQTDRPTYKSPSTPKFIEISFLGTGQPARKWIAVVEGQAVDPEDKKDAAPLGDRVLIIFQGLHGYDPVETHLKRLFSSDCDNILYSTRLHVVGLWLFNFIKSTVNTLLFVTSWEICIRDKDATRREYRTIQLSPKSEPLGRHPMPYLRLSDGFGIHDTLEPAMDCPFLVTIAIELDKRNWKDWRGSLQQRVQEVRILQKLNYIQDDTFTKEVMELFETNLKVVQGHLKA